MRLDGSLKTSLDRTRMIAAVGATRAVASSGLIVLTYVSSHFGGVEATGRLLTALALIVGISVISRLGVDLLAVRIIGVAHGRGDVELARDFYWTGLALVAITSVLLSLITWLCAPRLSSALVISTADLGSVIVAAPAVAMAAFSAASHRAFGQPSLAQLFETGAFALVTAIVISTARTFFLDLSPSAAGNVTSSFAVTAGLVLGATIIGSLKLVGRASEANFRRGVGILWENAAQAVSFWALSLFQYLSQWASVALAGALLAAFAVVELGVAQRYAMLIFVLLGTVGGVLAPRYAAMFAAGEHDAIRNKESQTVRKMLLAVAPFAIALLAWPRLFTDLFGVGTDTADQCLRVMVIGQLINVACGCSSHIMVAIGRAKEILCATVAGVSIGMAVSLLMASRYGPIGLAIGQALSVCVPALLARARVHMHLRNISASRNRKPSWYRKCSTA